MCHAGPRFPPPRLLGRLPPERAASFFSGRHPRSLNESSHSPSDTTLASGFTAVGPYFAQPSGHGRGVVSHGGGHRRSPVGFGCKPFNRTEDPTMTDAMMSLRRLLEKSSDAELLREMVGYAA